ncbi:MAG: cyanophycinase [Candidatus Methanomethylicia archaeon]|nr:cyanophycinase [Candidatus Methanomethylicia archaeon]MCX8168974.1 cyanophycinase [Candidatus Methanomethylicia archaeon]MDW7988706.1 cyanophycinase [Nitrososphaerota archaeon]
MKLLIAGGAILEVDEIIKSIVELSGGHNCKLGIIPLASGSPYESWENHKNCFKRFNANPILIDITSENYRINSFSNEIVNLISNLDGIFFTGGVQERIIEGLIVNGKETPVLTAIKKLYLSGKLIAGSSAGAAIMSNPMIYEGMDMNVKIGVGLGLLMDGKLIVDQHFIQRGRFPRLFEAMLKTGVKLGIGIDEKTALKIENNIGEVIGKSIVVILEMKNKNNFKLSCISQGDIIKLNNLEVHVDEKKKILEKTSGDSKRKDYFFDILTPHGFHNALIKLYEGKNIALEVLVIRILDDKDHEKRGYAYRFVFENDSETVFYSEHKDKISTVLNINVYFERKNIKIIFENGRNSI